MVADQRGDRHDPRASLTVKSVIEMDRSGPIQINASFGNDVRAVRECRVYERLEGIQGFVGEFVLEDRAPVELANEVRLIRVDCSPPELLMTGYVATCQSAEEITRIKITSSPQIGESQMPRVTTNLPIPEVLFTMMLEAGLPPEKVRVADLHVNHEPIVSCFPVDGLTFGSTSRILGVDFMPLADFRLWPGLADQFRSYSEEPADYIAVVHADGTFMKDAIDAAYSAALAATRMVYGTGLYSLTRSPNDSPLSYDRESARRRATVRTYVSARGLFTGRIWQGGIRSRTFYADQVESPLERWPDLPTSPPSESILLAWEAISIAADRDYTPSMRHQALWMAAEYYTATTRLEKLLERQDLSRIRDVVRSIGLEPRKMERVEECLSMANSPPLLIKLTERARLDKAPLSDLEVSTLKRTRTRRNDAAHGRSADAEERDLQEAARILARLVTFRWFREADCS